MVPSKRLLVVVLALLAAGAFQPFEALAQRGAARHVRVRTVVVGAWGSPWSPYYFDPFFPGYYASQYGPYPPYPRYRYEQVASLRVQVTPRDAEVYIDGYLAGTVDDFDGVFQRLRVPLGEHEISIYREGFRTLSEKMLFRPYESYHLKQAMEPLAAGEPNAARPAPSATPARGPAGTSAVPLPPAGRRGTPRSGEGPRAREERRAGDRFGTVAVRVQPRDAVVFIDDERWDAPEGSDRLLVELSEGAHRVEVRRDGYRAYSSTVRVEAGQTSTLNVSLPPDR